MFDIRLDAQKRFLDNVENFYFLHFIYYLLRSIHFRQTQTQLVLFALSVTTYAYTRILHKQTISNLGHISFRNNNERNSCSNNLCARI
jgi:hypothetical protein